jgi:type IV secretion system protein VirD4
MGIVKLIEDFDAKYGIPRPAEFQHLLPFHACMRLMRHAALMFFLIVAGLISAYLLWLSAGYLQVAYQTRLVFLAVIVGVLMIALAEAAHEVLPYYRIKQRLTYGTARWADEAYLRSKKLAVKVGANLEGLTRGSIRIGKLRKGYDLVLSETEWLRHFAIFGPPGSGKSKTFLMNILRDVSRGASAIVLDPKGELFVQTAYCFRDVYRLDLLDPTRSDRWNFVPDCKGDSEFAHQMAATMIGIEGTKHSTADPFWNEAEVLLLTAILLHLPNEVPEPTPQMVFEYLAMRDLKKIDGEMSMSKDPLVRMTWGAFNKTPPQTLGSVVTGLMNKLQSFQPRNAQAVCAPITPADRRAGVRKIDFKKLRRPGTAIFLVVAEGDATRYKNLLSTFFGQAVNQLRLDPEDKQAASVMMLLDEAANVPIVGLKEIAGVGRGRQIGLGLGYQNMPQVQDQYGHDGANAILGAIGTTIFLPGLDDATSQFASRRIGQETSWSRTTIDAHGKARDSERMSETGRALMDATELRQMVPHAQCIVIHDTTPPIKASYPEYAVREQRARPNQYGQPTIVSLLEVEEKIRLSLAQGREAELKAIVQQGEQAAGFAPPPDNRGEEPVEVGADAKYQKMFDRMCVGLPPEDQVEQSQIAQLIWSKFKESESSIQSWQDIKAFESAIDDAVRGKTSVPVSTIAIAPAVASSSTTVPPVPAEQSTPEPARSKPAKPNSRRRNGAAKDVGVQQQPLFYNNGAVAKALVDSARCVVGGNGERPTLSAEFLEDSALLSEPRPGVVSTDVLR